MLGPEAPLIAIGGGLAALAVHLVKRDAPAQATVVIGAAGSFAAISTLLGSPIVGAFLLMEVAGLAGPLVGVVLAPGLLAAGIGSLVFLGLNNITGWGTFSLGVPELPPFETIEATQFLWAIVIGLIGAVLGSLIRSGARLLQPVVDRRRLLLTPLLGAGVALCAIVFHVVTDRGVDQVLFSGENALAPLIQNADSWTVGALVLLVVTKSLAYAMSLSSFRGGPTFPAMFIGAALGVALSHLPGLPMVAGVAMGIGAMAVTMLRLPLTSVLLTVLFLQSDGVTLMPLVIVAVVVAYVASVRLTPPQTGDRDRSRHAGRRLSGARRHPKRVTTAGARRAAPCQAQGQPRCTPAQERQEPSTCRTRPSMNASSSVVRCVERSHVPPTPTGPRAPTGATR